LKINPELKAIMNGNILTNQNIPELCNKEQLRALLEENNINEAKVKKRVQYAEELEQLQIELLKLQNWVLKYKKRVVIIFEGRDAAGKGGAIRRFTRYLNTRSARVVALGKPSDTERGQWYFRRHIKELPTEGEIVFFDRSWYNRAVVEPVMGFCTEQEYRQFMQQVPEFEGMLYEDGVQFVKLWFSISSEEQARRFEKRKNNPLKQWKLSPVDLKSRDMWNEYTHYIWEMFIKTHTNFSPWFIIQTDSKKEARLESIRFLLSKFDYEGKEDVPTRLYPDPNIVQRFHRSMYGQI